MPVFSAGRAAALAMLLAACSAGGASAARRAPTTDRTTPRRAPTTDRTAPRPCHTRDLRLRVRPRPSDASAEQLTADVEFTNTSVAACTLRGYPAVRFSGRSASSHDPLAHQTDEIRTVVLASRGRAQSTLTYLVDAGAVCGGHAPFRPATILVTAPGTAAPLGVPWLGKSVDDCHGGATHPGTYISAMH